VTLHRPEVEPRNRIPRDCFTCAHSPKWRGPGTPAGCDAMTLDEQTDGPILDFCDAAEVSEEPHPGWPSKTADCPGWTKR